MLLNLTHIGQIALPVSDVERSEAFYRDVLGLPKLFRFGDLTFFDCAGVRLLLEKSREAFKPQGCIYFRCADIALTVAELTRRGIAFRHPPHLIAKMDDHDLWMAFFTDPDGHMLAVMHEAPKATRRRSRKSGEPSGRANDRRAGLQRRRQFRYVAYGRSGGLRSA